MRSSLRLLTTATVAAASLAVPLGASAEPASTTFAVRGHEYAFTSTVGCFAGTAAGDAAESGAWTACVEHDPLGSSPTYVTGGRFVMGTRSATGHYDFVTGTFVDHGGTIETIDPGTDCTNQQYAVTGALQNVTTTTSTGGTGDFRVTLTHFRTRFFGRCIAYRATVVGTATFAY
jgi:hypothetical protein